MEDGTWNKAFLFTSHAPWVQWIVNRQTGGSMSAGGGGEMRGETMPARQTRGRGGGTLAIGCKNHRRLWRREGRLDQAREGIQEGEVAESHTERFGR